MSTLCKIDIPDRSEIINLPFLNSILEGLRISGKKYFFPFNILVSWKSASLNLGISLVSCFLQDMQKASTVKNDSIILCFFIAIK